MFNPMIKQYNKMVHLLTLLSIVLSVLHFTSSSQNCKEVTFKDTLIKFSLDEVGDFSMSMKVDGCVTPQIVSSRTTIIECYKQNVPIIKESAIENMPELTTLVFSDNNLHKIKFGAFVNLPKLEDVVLVDNKIRLIEVGVFSIIPSVSRIRLKGNQLSFFEHGIFTNMPNLRTLYLSHNKLDTIESEWFDVDSGLSVLDLSHNLIRRVPAKAFQNTKKIEVLVLNNNKILTISEVAFEHLKTLFNLNLSNNRIYQLTGDVFAPLIAIDELQLHGNNLTYIHNNILEGIHKNLSVITIYSNPWQCACYNDIHGWASKRIQLEVDVVVGCKLQFNPICVIPMHSPDKCLEDPDEELDYKFYKQFNKTVSCK